MRLLVHLVRADVRRFRWLLAAWVLSEVLITVLTGLRPVLDSAGALPAFGLLGSVLFLTRWLGMIVIVPLVVQAHPVVGSEAFWMTRPIPPRTLLASKALLLGGTFVGVSALCEAVLMAASHVAPVDIVRVTFQTLLFQTLWLVILMTLSATTRNLARFFLVAAGVLVSLVMLFGIMTAVAVRGLREGEPVVGDVAERAMSSPAPTVTLLLLLITAGVVLLVVQYRTRSARFSVGAGAATAALAILIVSLWPSHEPLPVPAWTSGLRLQGESPTGEFSTPEGWTNWGLSDSWQMARVRLRLAESNRVGWPRSGLLKAHCISTRAHRSSPRGTVDSTTLPFESVDNSPTRIVMRHVLGVERVLGASQGPFPLAPAAAIVVSQTDFRKFSPASGTYRGRFLVDLERIEIAATLPLRAGAGYVEPRRRLTIDEVVAHTNAVAIRVRQVNAGTIFDSEALAPLSFYLRNRAAGEALLGSPRGGIAVSGGLGLALLFGASAYSADSGGSTGFSSVVSHFRFPGDYDRKPDAFEITPGWLSRAELVIVRTVPVGSVTRTVEIPGFVLRALPPIGSR